MAEVLLQGLRPRRHVLHGVVLLVPFLIDAVPRGAMSFVEVVPVPAQRFQAIEVQLLVILLDDQLGLGLGPFFFFDDFTVFRLFPRGSILGLFFQFQNRIFLKLLLDALLERHDGELKDFHRLNHAGSQNHLLLHPLTHVRIKSHRSTSMRRQEGDKGRLVSVVFPPSPLPDIQY
jgi:hypothetical protein